MQRFTDLRVWQRSHGLVLKVYRLAQCFPADERYGLVAQLRRAAVSVSTNIAERSKREGRQDYTRFLNIAEGSPVETECLLITARDLAYLSADTVEPLLGEIKEIARMLHYLRIKVERETTAALKRAA